MCEKTRPVMGIVGLGPRGTSAIERLGANLDHLYPDGSLELHLVDEFPPGPGRVWRVDQTRELVMNTLAGAVTNFTDSSVTCDGSIIEGPNLYEWCRLVVESVAGGIGPAVGGRMPPTPGVLRAFAQQAVSPRVTGDPGLLAEIRNLLPWSHPSRALYGEYLAWCFDRALALLPERVIVFLHRERAIDVQEVTADAQEVVLESGERIRCDALILALGWLDAAPSAPDASIATAVAGSDLLWIRPDSPIDQRIEELPAGEPVIVRGLGMGFFDAMALLTIGRGGAFTRASSSSGGGLQYLPSGEEPILYVGSRRGMPFRAKSLYCDLPPTAPQPFLTSQLPNDGRRLDFDQDIMPLIVKDALWSYYRTLYHVKPTAFHGPVESILVGLVELPVDSADLAAVIVRCVPDIADRLDFTTLEDPAPGKFDSPTEFDRFVRGYVAQDLTEAGKGTGSALKAAAWSVSSARAVLAPRAAFGGFEGRSFARSYQRFLSFAGMLGSGPPAFRLQQLLALQDAGLVHFIGPEVQVTVEDGAFIAESPHVRGSRVSARALLDAWMHMPAVTRTADPLLASLLRRGAVRAFRIENSDGTFTVTGGVEIDGGTSQVIGADGQPNPGLFLAGVPAEDTQGYTLISPLPGTNAPMLRETDRMTRAALGLLRFRSTAGQGASLRLHAGRL